LALGYEHPDFLLNVLTAQQISEWEAFNRIQPIGSERYDFYFAQLMTTFHNIAVGFSGSKTAKQFEMKDFIPNWTGIEEEPEVMSPEEIKQFWITFAENHNKKVLEDEEQKKAKKGKQ
jgi:hypothetical protein